MSHIEAHYFRIHVDAILAVDNPEIEPYDQNAYDAQGTYSDRDAEESLAHWEEQRDDNVELLRALEPAQLSRTALHPALGRIVLRQSRWVNGRCTIWVMSANWPNWCARNLYYPEIGPFQMPCIRLRP